jgi:hypothetical protein
LAAGRAGACTALLAAALVLGVSPAGAETLWWFGDAGDDLWSNPANWELSSGGAEAPSADLDVYITTSDHNGLDELEVFPLIDSTMMGVDRAESATLYVGGWPYYLDAHHGSPLGRYGVLDVAGDLYIADRTAGSPPCYYLRLGYRGARGTLNQSGGTISSCTLFSVAYDSADSVGIWNLSGGEMVGFGLDLGVQGTGILDMTGGEIRPMESCGRRRVREPERRAVPRQPDGPRAQGRIGRNGRRTQ